MKRILVSKCPCGREIDAAVMRVMGWERSRDGGWWKLSSDGKRLELDKYVSPSFNMRYAWFLATELSIAVIPLQSGRWRATAHNAIPDDYTAYTIIDLSNGEVAEIASLAICRAYLRAKGVEYVEVLE